MLRRPLDHGQDMLVAVAIDADRRHQDMVADMQTVDLDDLPMHEGNAVVLRQGNAG